MEKTYLSTIRAELWKPKNKKSTPEWGAKNPFQPTILLYYPFRVDEN
jgi:hypothetical protein